MLLTGWFKPLFNYLATKLDNLKEESANKIIADLLKIEGRKIPKSFREHATHIPEVERKNLNRQQKRQIKHN